MRVRRIERIKEDMEVFQRIVKTPEFTALTAVRGGYIPNVVECDWDEASKRRAEAFGWKRIADREEVERDRSERVADKERRTPKYPQDPGLPDYILAQGDNHRVNAIVARAWAGVLQGDLPDFSEDKTYSLITAVTTRELNSE